jgi:hypothetical protein
VLRKEEKRCTLTEGLSPVTLGKGAAPSMGTRRLGLMMMTLMRLRMRIRRMRKRMWMPWMRMMMTRVD